LGHKQEMTGKDRTNEFRAVAEGLAKRNPFVPKPQTKKALINNTISSNKLAAEIGREISQTAEKMQELTKRKFHFVIFFSIPSGQNQHAFW
jgi:hypothetical protein